MVAGERSYAARLKSTSAPVEMDIFSISGSAAKIRDSIPVEEIACATRSNVKRRQFLGEDRIGRLIFNGVLIGLLLSQHLSVEAPGKFLDERTKRARAWMGSRSDKARSCHSCLAARWMHSWLLCMGQLAGLNLGTLVTPWQLR